MTTRYLTYGLRISSDIAIPGLAEDSHGAPDLLLFVQSRPPWLEAALAGASAPLHVSRDPAEGGEPSFVFESLGGGKFFRLNYSDGTRFVLDRCAAQLWGEWRAPLTLADFTTYLVGPVLGFVLRQRGITCLHAAAVEIGGRAVALVGPAAAGKSTTAAAFAMRGHRVLCEDVTPLVHRGGEFLVQPGYPRICLWPDSARNLFGAAGALPRLTPNWEKCFLSLPPNGGPFPLHPVPLDSIYILGQRHDGPQAPHIEALSPQKAFMDLVQNTYMNYLLDPEKRAVEFEFLSQLVETVRVCQVTPHADPARIGQLCGLLLEDAAHAANVAAGSGLSVSF